MSMKAYLTKQGMKVMQNPQFMKLMQDERVMKLAMQAFQLRGKVQEHVDQKVHAVARSLNLATAKDLRELKRNLRKLEQELQNAKTNQETPWSGRSFAGTDLTHGNHDDGVRKRELRQDGNAGTVNGLVNMSV